MVKNKPQLFKSRFELYPDSQGTPWANAEEPNDFNLQFQEIAAVLGWQL